MNGDRDVDLPLSLDSLHEEFWAGTLWVEAQGWSPRTAAAVWASAGLWMQKLQWTAAQTNWPRSPLSLLRLGPPTELQPLRLLLWWHWEDCRWLKLHLLPQHGFQQPAGKCWGCCFHRGCPCCCDGPPLPPGWSVSEVAAPPAAPLHLLDPALVSPWVPR